MPANRNALLRYRTIDRCLRNRQRRWTLDDLIAAVSDALYDYEGRQVDVARRTVQLDLQNMRSDRLGYRAPIEVYDRKYYRYADPDYAITDSPLSEQDVGRLREVVDLLHQFSGFRQMEAFGGLVGRLRDQLGVGRTDGRRIIDLEHNAELRGLEWVDPLYDIIAAGHRARIRYQSFTAREARKYPDFEPYFLKESRNRYFVLGRLPGKPTVLILALDRIQAVEDTGESFAQRPGLDIDTYFAHTVGVSVTDQPPERVVLRATRHRAPYLMTKPIHRSQRVKVERERYVELTLDVQLTFELESALLAFGPDVQVVAPASLRRRLRAAVRYSAAAYDAPLDAADWRRQRERFERFGYLDLGSILTPRESRRLGTALTQVQQRRGLFAAAGPEHHSSEVGSLIDASRLEIVHRVASDLGEQLYPSAEVGTGRPLLGSTPGLYLTRYRAGYAGPFAPVGSRRLFLSVHRWREGEVGPEVLPASHRAPRDEGTQQTLAAGGYERGFAGERLCALLVEEGTLLRMRVRRGSDLVVAEVG